MERICFTCGARQWDKEKSTYICKPDIFTQEPWNPNGGRRLRPGACPENIVVKSDKTTRMLRDLLKKK